MGWGCRILWDGGCELSSQMDPDRDAHHQNSGPRSDTEDNQHEKDRHDEVLHGVFGSGKVRQEPELGRVLGLMPLI